MAKDNATIRVRLVAAPGASGKGPRTSFGASWRFEPGAAWQRVAGPYGPIVYTSEVAAERAATEARAEALKGGPFRQHFGSRELYLGPDIEADPIAILSPPSVPPDKLQPLSPTEMGELGRLIGAALNAYPPALAWARARLK